VVDDGVDGVDDFVDEGLWGGGGLVLCQGGIGRARTRGVYWKCSVSRASACRAESAILEAGEMVVANLQS
jgi:hypothetical protein